MENQTVPVPAPSLKYAGFWIRFVAVMVDGIILVPITLIIGFIVGLLAGFSLYATGGYGADHSTMTSALGIIVNVGVSWLYFSLLTYFYGATWGKMLVGITVKSDDLTRLSFGRVVLRETIGKLVSGIILSIGYIIAGVTQKKQGLHDMIARSVVVYKNPAEPHTAGLIVGIVLACILPIIAIIGILSSVVLVSLNAAREKGFDAQTRVVISQMRVQVETLYDPTKGSYSVAHNCSTGIFANPSFAPIISQLKDPSGLKCFAEGETYAISVPLTTPGENFCLDVTGYNGDAVATDNGSKAFCQASSTSN